MSRLSKSTVTKCVQNAYVALSGFGVIESLCVCSQDARRRKQFKDHTGNKITLEAVLNTTCSKCGCKGTTACLKGLKEGVVVYIHMVQHYEAWVIFVLF